MDFEKFAEMLARANSDETDDYVDFNVTPIDVTRAFEVYDQNHVFKRGDLIRWKKGMRIFKMPSYKSVAVFLEYRDDIPEFTGKDGEGTYAEGKDCLIGVVDNDKDFFVFVACSRRFEPAC